MNDPIAIPLIFGAPFRRRLFMFASARFGAELGVRRQALLFELLEFLARAGHGLSGGFQHSENSDFNRATPQATAARISPAAQKACESRPRSGCLGTRPRR